MGLIDLLAAESHGERSDGHQVQRQDPRQSEEGRPLQLEGLVLHPNIGCELLSLENWQDSRQVSEEERNQRRRLEEGDVGA